MNPEKTRNPFSNLALGLWSFFRGASLMVRRAELFGWALVPVAATLLVLVGLLGGGYLWVWAKLRNWSGSHEAWWSGWLRWTLVVVIFAAVFILAYLLFALIRQIVAAPFNDVLSLKSEKSCRRLIACADPAGARGSVHGEPAMRNVLRALADTLRLVAAEYLAYLVVLPFLLVPFVGVLPIWTVRAYYAGVNAVDVALSCRGFTYAEKKAIFKSNRARILGLGLGMTLFDITIILALFSLPASVVGGTLVYMDLEREGRLMVRPE